VTARPGARRAPHDSREDPIDHREAIMYAGPYDRLTLITSHDRREATKAPRPYDRLTAIMAPRGDHEA
jgi:hypothetical protein